MLCFPVGYTPALVSPSKICRIICTVWISGTIIPIGTAQNATHEAASAGSRGGSCSELLLCSLRSEITGRMKAVMSDHYLC